MNKKYTLPLLIIASLLSGCKPNEEKAIEAIKKDIRTSGNDSNLLIVFYVQISGLCARCI
ncbi:hypothetical protein AGJ16_11375 [Cronobacter sakazakii]|nr:hypothetical protein [Cronobacter sakazakii]EGT5766263.1 hypothetical protein [Cronobacter sakazakii]PUW87323.1 hypothetical protein CCQ26_19060 [Cronobacter sakazakii]